MKQAINLKIGIAIIAVAVGGGAILIIGHQGRRSDEIAMVRSSPPAQIIHTAAWYVAHPDILKQDEARCAGDAATLPQAACQNAYSADGTISESEMENAAIKNGSSRPDGNSKGQ